MLWTPKKFAVTFSDPSVRSTIKDYLSSFSMFCRSFGKTVLILTTWPTRLDWESCILFFLGLIYFFLKIQLLISLESMFYICIIVNLVIIWLRDPTLLTPLFLWLWLSYASLLSKPCFLNVLFYLEIVTLQNIVWLDHFIKFLQYIICMSLEFWLHLVKSIRLHLLVLS